MNVQSETVASERSPLLNSADDDKDSNELADLPLWQIVCMVSWQVGITFGWNAMFVMGTPLFKSLGMSNFLTSFAWLAGPLSGLIFQPICCSISDKLTNSWGRRRPFVLAGGITGAIGMLGFAYPQELASALGGGNGLAIAVAIVSLWIMNIGLNIIQGPGWALIFDCLPARQQSVGNAALSVLGAASGLAAAVLGAAPLTKAFPFLGTQQMALFWLGIVVLLASIAPSLLFSPERPFVPQLSADELDGRAQRAAAGNALSRLLVRAWRGAVRILRQIFVVGLYEMDATTFWIVFVYFLVNCAGSPAQFFGTDYFGSVVYHGVADAPKGSAGYLDYEAGVRMGSLGMALGGVVNIVTSVLLPWLIKRLGYRPCWATSQAIFAVAFFLVLLPACQTVAVSMAIVTTLGISNGTSAVVPFSMIGSVATTKDKAGLTIAILNSSQVLAQLVSNFTSGGVATLTDNPAAGIATGSGWSIVALFVTVFLMQVPGPKPDTDTDVDVELLVDTQIDEEKSWKTKLISTLS